MNDLETALAALPDAVAEMDRLRGRIDVKQRLIKLTGEEVRAKPHLVWNAFVTLLDAVPYEHMTELQRCTQLAFRYDCEVHFSDARPSSSRLNPDV